MAKRRPRPRRWWQVLLRAGIITTLVLGALYVALPWLLPAETIRRRLEASLAEQLGTRVSVGAMHFRWDDGVVIDGLTIDNPPGFPDDPMVRVGRIRCDFSPLRFVLQRRIAWMDVEKLAVKAQDDADGRLNTDCLARMKMDVDTQRLRVRQSELSVFLHDQPRPLVARISDLQVLRARGGLGRVTMTGSFEQAGSPAPISLRISVGDEEEHAATVDCRFSDLDLAQLPRSKAVWGDLPIESLRGRCGGQLVFAVGKNLRVEELRLELLTENLVVKPLGAAPLPKIDQAGLRLEANLDALSERAHVRKFHLRLPGVSLSGEGVVYADLLRGDWEALDHVRLRGTVYPDRLSTLVTGREALPDGLVVRGPVEFSATAQQQRDALGVDLRLDASATSIHTPKGRLKPAQQALRAQWKVSVGHADGVCPMDVELARLDVGDNTITAVGRIADLSAFRPSETSKDPDQVITTILEVLKGVRLRGTIKLNEPLVLVQPFFDTPPGSLDLRGRWSGPWSFLPGSKPKFNLGLRGGPEAVLRAGNSFAKPKEQELSLELAAVIDPEKRNITNILIDVLTEKGRISLDETTLRLPEKDEPLRCRGKFEIDRIEGFRNWMPGLDDFWQASGEVKGTFGSEVLFATGKAETDAEVDLTHLSFSFGEYFTKPAGEEAKLYFDTKAESDECSFIGLTLGFKGATCVSSLYHDDRDSVEASVQIKDLAWLESSSPLLHRALQGGGIDGEVLASCGMSWDAGIMYYAMVAESEKLNCTIGGKSSVVNLRDKHVTLKSKGMVGPDRKGTRYRCDLWATTLTVGGSSVAIPDLKTKWDRKTLQKAAERGRPFDACEELSGEVQIVGDAGDLLGEVFPRWASWAGRHKLEGNIRADGRVHMDRDALSAKLRVDAGDVGVQDVEGFTKPAGESVVATLDVATPRDFSAPQVRRLTVETKAARLDAQVQGKARLNEAGLPVGIEPTEAHMTAVLKDAAALAKFWPALKEHNLAGRAEAKMHWVADKSEMGTVSELTMNATDLRGEYRGKICRLDGDLRVEGIDLLDGKALRVKRLKTENLEFAAGDNHGWLLADVQLEPGAPSGTFHLLFESLDDKDLADWLSEPESTSSPASEPTTRADADVALQRRANQLIVQARDLFQNADLTGRVSASHYRTYDKNVGQHYPTRDLELSLRVKDNGVKLQYDTGLYGGMVLGRMGVNMVVPKPVVTSRTEYVDVKATKTIQPQISRMFPGNTVSGQFSRTEDVYFSLRDLLCNAMDVEYRLCPEGTAKMVATDGVVVGKAAPDFMTNMFPGLNLTKYPYRTMTAFTKFLPDGGTENETFFFGAHDLYMEGVTQRDYTIQYTVGLVMLGGAFPAEALRDWKQGRIPILKVKGRIEDGKLVDDTVSYPLPNETLFEIFVKNNLVYRAWVNLQKKPSPGIP